MTTTPRLRRRMVLRTAKDNGTPRWASCRKGPCHPAGTVSSDLFFAAESHIDTAPGDIELDGNIFGYGSLIKTGTGTLTLTQSSDNGCSSIVDVAQGTLLDTYGAIASATFVVENGATYVDPDSNAFDGVDLGLAGRATSGTGLLLNWTNDGTMDQYFVEASEDSGATWNTVAYTDAGDKAVLITGLTVNHAYILRLTGLGDPGDIGERALISLSTLTTDTSGVFTVSFQDLNGTFAQIHGPHSRASVFSIDGGTMTVAAGSMEEAVREAISGHIVMNGDTTNTYLSAYALNFEFTASFNYGSSYGPALEFQDTITPPGTSYDSFIKVYISNAAAMSASVQLVEPVAIQDAMTPGSFAIIFAGSNSTGGTVTFHMTDTGNVAGHYSLSTNGGSGTSWYSLTPNEDGEYTIEFASGVTVLPVVVTPDGTDNDGDTTLTLDSLSNGTTEQSIGAYFAVDKGAGVSQPPSATSPAATLPVAATLPAQSAVIFTPKAGPFAIGDLSFSFTADAGDVTGDGKLKVSTTHGAGPNLHVTVTSNATPTVPQKGVWFQFKAVINTGMTPEIAETNGIITTDESGKATLPTNIPNARLGIRASDDVAYQVVAIDEQNHISIIGVIHLKVSAP